MRRASLWILMATMMAACGTRPHYIRGTKVEKNKLNQEIIEFLEGYRQAVVDKDVGKLFLMTSKGYWEDGATINGKDDYSREKLPVKLAQNFAKARDIRYSMQYMKVRSECPNGKTGERCRVFVDVKIDASYTIDDALNREERLDMQKLNQLVVVWEDDSWKIYNGM